jgi:GNAT superfamily N-acetyltransferase
MDSSCADPSRRSELRLYVEPFDPEKHDRGAFSCGKEQLNRYLREVANRACERYTARTFVAVEVDVVALPRPIVGFYTLALCEYHDKQMDPTTARALGVRNLKNVPAILLGQFAVSEGRKRQGIGTRLLAYAFREAFSIGCKAGGSCVVTDPIDDEARSFFKQHGFLELGDKRWLFMEMKTLERLFPDVAGLYGARAELR